MYTHIGINVTDLRASIDFYTKLFGVEPVKVKPDYAKFLVEKARLNFTLNLRDKVEGNRINHFGIQVKDTEEVIAHRDRLRTLGLETREEMNVTCCYAVQDKFWVTDPDGNEWEFFVVKEDADSSSDYSSSCCSA